MSGTLRYSTISDWGSSEDPGYNLFDRSLDLQFQLLKEKGWQPSVALGFRDVLGTGVYSAEYLVATKTVARDFTLTGGIGWGRLASVGGVENPFCSVVGQLLRRARSTTARAARRPSTRCSTARRWASSAASSGGRRSTS